MKDNNNLELIMKESFNLCRAYVLACLTQFRKEGRKGQRHLVSNFSNYFDLVVSMMQQQGQTPTGEISTIKDEFEKAVIVDVEVYDIGISSIDETANLITGQIVKHALGVFGMETKFIAQSSN